MIVPCPKCGLQLKVPDALLGKTVTCRCGNAFTAPEPAVACPGCGGAVAEGSASCPDCGYRLSASPTAEEEKLNVCPNKVCGTLNPPGERLCQRCNTPLPGATGQVIGGKYRLDRPLATGGFGVVYEATALATGERVAVKEMIAVEPKEFVLRRTFFRREAEILKALQHIPIVPKLHEFIEDPAASYLVLEFIPGDNLLNLLDRPGAKPYPVPQVAAWGAKVCEALSHMHRLLPPVIHRDMKPENIMLLPDGMTIRLIDFGTAREMGHGAKERRVAKTKVYTEGYAPPEQVLGKAEPRSDLFALAGTLYHLAVGRAPDGAFTGKELLKTLDGHPAGERWFWELLAVNLSEDIHDRYFSARDLKGDLERGTVVREMHCLACGTATPAREPYCRGCAAPIAPPGTACHQCDQPTLMGSRFCTGCGTRL